MSKDQNAALKGALPGIGRPSALEDFEAQVRSWWKGEARKMESLCGSPEMARKLLVTAINVVSKTPKIIECEFSTFVNCLLTSAELNLFPGAMQECAYVPLNNSRNRRMECNFWPMYPGVVKLAFNSGHLKAVSCNVVYHADEFDFEEGTNPFIRHRSFLGDLKDRGERHCAYGAVQLHHGEWQIRVLPMHFIIGIKNRSPAAKTGDSPWNANEDSFDQMIRKTALKQALKFVPKNPELARVIEMDNENERPDLAKPAILPVGSLIDMATAGAATSSTQPEKNDQPRLPEPPTGIVMPERRDPEAEMLESDRALAANKGGREA